MGPVLRIVLMFKQKPSGSALASSSDLLVVVSVESVSGSGIGLCVVSDSRTGCSVASEKRKYKGW